MRTARNIHEIPVMDMLRNGSTKERFFFFESGGLRLLGVLHGTQV